MTLPKAMILAACGQQLDAPLTSPAALETVGGQHAIIRLLQQLADAGVPEAVINLQEFGDQVEQAVYVAQMAGYFPNLEVNFSYEPKLLGTGGGVKRALPLLGDAPFFVINVDAVWAENRQALLPELALQYEANDMDAILAIVETDYTRLFREDGDFVLKEDGGLVFAPEKRLAPYVYTGIHMTTAEILANFPSENFCLCDVWRESAVRHKLFGYVYRGAWADLDTPKGLQVAQGIAAGPDAFRVALRA